MWPPSEESPDPIISDHKRRNNFNLPVYVGVMKEKKYLVFKDSQTIKALLDTTQAVSIVEVERKGGINLQPWCNLCGLIQGETYELSLQDDIYCLVDSVLVSLLLGGDTRTVMAHEFLTGGINTRATFFSPENLGKLIYPDDPTTCCVTCPHCDAKFGIPIGPDSGQCPRAAVCPGCKRDVAETTVEYCGLTIAMVHETLEFPRVMNHHTSIMSEDCRELMLSFLFF